jgi:O-antigen/teichoic acid export membrane protein
VSDAIESTTTSKAPLPEGTIPVAIGLFIAGITAYAFFKVGQLALGKEDFKPIVALWFTTFALIPGFLLPVEQELGRALAHRRALNHGSRPVVRKMLPLAGGLSSVLVIATLAASPWLTHNLFEGNWVVTASLILTVLAFAPMHLARGIASGSGRFTAYGLILGIDGATRIIACVVLWQLNVTAIGAYALAVALSPFVAVLAVTLRGDLKTQDGPPAEFSELTPNLSWLLLGSVMAAALVNAGPLGVDVLAHSGDAEKVTAFGNGVLLARIPLFLFQAIQASLLPRLARLAAKGDLTEFVQGLALLLKIVVGVAVLGTFGSYVLGPWALEIMYEGGLDRRTLTLLAFASGLYMLCVAIAQAVIALRGHRWVAVGWLSAVVVFLTLTAFSSDDLYLRVEIGLVGASITALIIFGLALKSQIAAGVIPEAESMLDGVLDTPFE